MATSLGELCLHCQRGGDIGDGPYVHGTQSRIASPVHVHDGIVEEDDPIDRHVDMRGAMGERLSRRFT